jgi:hypothetical protein
LKGTSHMHKKTSLAEMILAAQVLSLFLVSSILASSFTVPSKDCRSIGQALLKAKQGDTVWVEKGNYREHVSVGASVSLISREQFGAVINGGGGEKTITLANNSLLRGFEITGGIMGVYSAGQGNRIIKCRIHGNSQTGIMCVGNLPLIEDNVIVFNHGSGIQGWDTRSTISAISHNTIAFNSNNGVSLGGNSQLIIENCIIANNEKLGLKCTPTVKVSLKRNCFFGNTEFVETLPSENFAYDPIFAAPRKMDFTLSKDSQCNNMGSDNQNLGARFGY